MSEASRRKICNVQVLLETHRGQVIDTWFV